MARVQSVFQENRFQQGVFQDEWGKNVFQRNVFQDNAFDVETFILRIINEGLTIAGTRLDVLYKNLKKFINEGIDISHVTGYLRGRIQRISETIKLGIDEILQNNVFQQNSFQVSNEAVKIHGMVKKINESILVSGIRKAKVGIRVFVNETVEFAESILPVSYTHLRAHET